MRMTFFVDIVAMTFGQPRVLFPAIGSLLLGGGPVTVGLLFAAFAVGALTSSVFSGRLGAVRRQGLAIERAIQAYGACVLGFGVVLLVATIGDAAGFLPGPPGVDVGAIVVAAVLLAGAGAADNVSAIFRSTILQAAAPTTCAGACRACSSWSSPAAPASATSSPASWRRSGSCGCRRCSAACS